MGAAGQSAPHRFDLGERDVDAQRLQLCDEPVVAVAPAFQYEIEPRAEFLRWRSHREVAQQMNGRALIARR